MNKNEVNVLDYIKNPPPGDYDQNYKDMLKLNLKTIELKNNILKKNFDYEVLQKLKKYIFNVGFVPERMVFYVFQFLYLSPFCDFYRKYSLK